MKKVVLIFVVLVVGIQFFRPEMNNPEQDPRVGIMSQLPMDEKVKDILHRACMDCHSYATQWPWYSKIAPPMWVIARDVKEGRRELNLSEWGNYSAGKQAKKLFQIAEIVTSGEMPMPAYIFLHPEADLTPEERKILADWAEERAESIGDGADDSESE